MAFCVAAPLCGALVRINSRGGISRESDEYWEFLVGYSIALSSGVGAGR